MHTKETQIFTDSVLEDFDEVEAGSMLIEQFRLKLENRIEAFESECVEQTERRFIEALKREAACGFKRYELRTPGMTDVYT